MLAVALIRKKLTRWYLQNRRDLPWRRTRDPYAIWVSEIMLQQTRVAAVIPYWERFLDKFPDVSALAQAPETVLLTAWSGLGYYSRARNMQTAARQIVEMGEFPRAYDALRSLKGVGDYTAAAVASIAFDLPHAVVDGNVRRVLMRLANDPQLDVQDAADRLLDKKSPGLFNQAVMELGALICLPQQPQCLLCPLRENCEARKQGTQDDVPPAKVRPATVRVNKTLLLVRRNQEVLLIPSTRVNGFWDLPEVQTPGMHGVTIGDRVGMFRHTIMNRLYLFEVRESVLKKIDGREFRWVSEEKLNEIPLSTAARKALSVLER